MIIMLLVSLSWGYVSEVQPYVDSFIQDSNGKVQYSDLKDLTIDMSTLGKIDGETVLGYCSRELFSPKRKVYLDKAHWKKMSSIERKNLLYHELGHCVCNLNHNSSKGMLDLSAGFPYVSVCPSDIMYPYEISKYCIEKFDRVYIDKMFKDCRILKDDKMCFWARKK